MKQEVCLGGEDHDGFPFAVRYFSPLYGIGARIARDPAKFGRRNCGNLPAWRERAGERNIFSRGDLKSARESCIIYEYAGMLELADEADSKSVAARRAGSTPATGRIGIPGALSVQAPRDFLRPQRFRRKTVASGRKICYT